MSLTLISNAFADTTASTAGPGGNMASILMLVGFVVIFYFLLWRPQAKRAKAQRDLISNLAKGDEVVTSGGLLGRINKLDDDVISLAITDTVEVKIQKNAVAGVLPKGTLK
jgi:preprotein translocase subunit YajC